MPRLSCVLYAVNNRRSVSLAVAGRCNSPGTVKAGPSRSEGRRRSPLLL